MSTGAASWLAASYAQSGRLDEAQTLISNYLGAAGTEPWWSNVPESAADIDRDPTGLLKYMIYMYPFKNQADLNHLLDGLRKAGLSE